MSETQPTPAADLAHASSTAEVPDLTEMPDGRIAISDDAQAYLRELLAKQPESEVAIRVFVTQPGTVHAETCIAYCRPGEQQEGDVLVAYEGFNAWIEAKSLPFLADANVDYRKDRLGGQLTIKAPNARTPKVNENSTIEERINYVLHNEVNPSLASHGGMVSLVEVVDGDTAVLQFGGGCQGCSAADVTLKQGVEKTLLAQIAGLKAVRDVTDHSQTENAFYR